jgi:hypothetical protein
MAFYTFNQNNSGGSFDYTPRSGISHYVIVEADSTSDAVDRAENIGLYFNGVSNNMDCGCCGDRWYEPWDENDEPMVYDQSVSDGHAGRGIKWIKGFEGFVHYKDGRVEGFWDSEETA